MRVDLSQGSREWLEWRKKGLGGSDVSAIMGCSKYKTGRELYLEKTGQAKPKDNSGKKFLFERGHRLEIVGRKYIEELTKDQYPPACYQHDDAKWMKVSLDGINYSGDTIIECKHVGKKAFDNILDGGEVPAAHYWQMVHGFNVTSAVVAHYVVIDVDEKCTSRVVDINEDDCIMLRENITEFWHTIENATGAPERAKGDVENLDGDNEFVNDMASYFEMDATIKALKKAQAEIKLKLESKAEVSSVECRMGRVTKYFRKGSSDYKKYLDDNKMTVPDSYEKEGTWSVRITAKQ